MSIITGLRKALMGTTGVENESATGGTTGTSVGTDNSVFGDVHEETVNWTEEENKAQDEYSAAEKKRKQAVQDLENAKKKVSEAKDPAEAKNALKELETKSKEATNAAKNAQKAWLKVEKGYKRTPEQKLRIDRVKQLGKRYKGKGKAGAIVGGLLLGAGLAYGAYYLFGKKDDAEADKAGNSTDAKNQTPPPAAETGETSNPAAPVDNGQTGATPATGTTGETTGTPPAANEAIYTVKKGDNLWNIVKAELTKKTGETPTDKKILEGVKKMMEENGLHYESDGYVVLIYPGDELKTSSLSAVA